MSIAARQALVGKLVFQRDSQRSDLLDPAIRSIVVHFHDQAGVDDFAKRLGVESRLTPKARYLWWPEMVIETLADKRYAAVED